MAAGIQPSLRDWCNLFSKLGRPSCRGLWSQIPPGFFVYSNPSLGMRDEKRMLDLRRESRRRDSPLETTHGNEPFRPCPSNCSRRETTTIAQRFNVGKTIDNEFPSPEGRPISFPPISVLKTQ